MNEEGFLDVETSILSAQAGGAVATPFITHSNTQDQELALRISPELYLKELVVGGFDRVYELGKVFRNEGLDNKHNFEFTSIEAYMAYHDYNDWMTLSEKLLDRILSTCSFHFQAFARKSMVPPSPPLARRKSTSHRPIVALM